MKKTFSKIYLGLIFLLLYFPIIVMIVYSFNDSKSQSVFTGFSFKWYKEFFGDRMLIDSLVNTLIIAVLSATIATFLGIFAAIAIYNMRGKKKKLFMSISNIPLINPEIVTGVSLMLMFVIVARIIGFELGFATVLFAHITFNLPYVILNILPKLRQMDPNLYEAALDLGCTPTKALFKVIIPDVFSGIAAGFLMAFTLSLDDFIISYFTSGSGFQTLPITIYSMLRKEISPSLNALSALLFATIFIILIISNILSRKSEKKQNERR